MLESSACGVRCDRSAPSGGTSPPTAVDASVDAVEVIVPAERVEAAEPTLRGFRAEPEMPPTCLPALMLSTSANLRCNMRSNAGFTSLRCFCTRLPPAAYASVTTATAALRVLSSAICSAGTATAMTVPIANLLPFSNLNIGIRMRRMLRRGRRGNDSCSPTENDTIPSR